MNEPNGFQQVVQDISDLFELQLELLKIDGKVAVQKGATAMVLIGIAFILAGSALTTLLVAAGYVLAESTDLSTGVSLLIIAFSAIVISLILALIALSAVKRAGAALNETQAEFTENVKWLKGVILHPKTSPRNQIRAESFDRGSAAAASPSTSKYSPSNHPSVRASDRNPQSRF